MSASRSHRSLVFGLGAGMVAVAMARASLPPLLAVDTAVRSLHYLPSADTARAASLGHTTLVADYYWMRAVQYFGSGWNHRLLYRDLYPLIELISDLDPLFSYAVLFGAIALPQNLGRETWVNIAESTRLLERGVRLFPNDHRFPLFAAYNHTQYHKNYRRAAEYLVACTKLPGCPSYVPFLATRVMATGGEAAAALAFAEDMAQAHAEDETFRRMIHERIKELHVERDLSALEQAIAEYRERHGALPASVNSLVTAGFIRQLPTEPFGGKYLYDPTTGATRSSTQSERLRVIRPYLKYRPTD